MKIYLLSVLLLLTAIYIPAEDKSASFDLIGFSDDGAYLAFETIAFDPVTERYFGQLQIVNVAANKYAENEITVSSDIDQKDLYNKMKSVSYTVEVKKALSKYGIVPGNSGIIAWERPGEGSFWHAGFPFINIDGVKEDYRLHLVTKEVSSNLCENLQEEDRISKIFTLTLYGSELSKILQKDSVLYNSRFCPYNYSLHKVYLYKEKIAVVIESQTPGGIRYKLIVTGTLDLPELNRNLLLDNINTESNVYSLKREVRMSNGEIIVRLISDEDTYNIENKTDSFRKLVSFRALNVNREKYSIILPEVQYISEYPYYIAAIFNGSGNLLVVQSKYCFYIFNADTNILSKKICPGKDKPMLGQDGRSGNLVRYVFSEDGMTLKGEIVHQGSFKYDISDPANPREIQYEVNFNISD